MTVTSFVDRILAYYENVGAADGNNTDRRQRILNWLQGVVETVWYARPWPWKRTSANVTMTNGTGDLPADFGDFGKFGGVYLPSTGQRLDLVDEQTIRDQRERPGAGATDTPKEVSVFGIDASFLQQLQTVSFSGTLKVVYERVPPTLDEAANVAQLQQIPVQFHQSALIPAVAELAKQSKGDATAQPDVALQRAIAIIARGQRPGTDGINQLPSVFGR